MTGATAGQLEITLAPFRERLVTHPLYSHLRDEGTLRVFMEAHVFAVWDFQSLLKALQRLVTCVEVPWLPTSDPEARRLLNEIGPPPDSGPLETQLLKPVPVRDEVTAGPEVGGRLVL